MAGRRAKESVSQYYDSSRPELSAAQSRTNHSDLIYSNSNRLLVCAEIYQALHLLASVIPSIYLYADGDFNYPSSVPIWFSVCLCVAVHRGPNQGQELCPFHIFPGTVKLICVLLLFQFWLIFGWSSSISTSQLTCRSEWRKNAQDQVLAGVWFDSKTHFCSNHQAIVSILVPLNYKYLSIKDWQLSLVGD